MRRLLALFVLVLPAFAQTDSPDANAQKAHKIVDQCIDALGGSAYLNIQSFKQAGRGYGFYRGEPGGVGVPFVRYVRLPDKERVEFFKQRDWIKLYVGDDGYDTTFHGTRKEDQDIMVDYLRRRQYSLDLVLRDWVRDPKTQFFYDGQLLVEARQVHQVTLVNAKNQAVTLSIDTVTFLPQRKTFTYRDEYKEKVEEAETYGNYRMEQGFQTPHIITRLKNGERTAERFLRSVEYNVTVPDSKFAPPPLDYNRKK